VIAVTTSWLRHLDADDREQFFHELEFAVGFARGALDVSGIEACLRDWRVTAEALSDPARREVLTGSPGDADFTEVPRPS